MSGRCDLVFKTPAGEDYCAQDHVVWFDPSVAEVDRRFETLTHAILIPNKRSDDSMRCIARKAIPVHVVDSYSFKNPPLNVTDQTSFRCMLWFQMTNRSFLYRVLVAGLKDLKEKEETPAK